MGRRLALSIGLLCSKTFDDAIFDELFKAKYGLDRADIVKMNIKGVFQIWMKDGAYHEIPLKECHAWTREGCKACPDFAAEHADISTGGIGAFNDWTLTLVRTDLGREIIDGMITDGVIETRPGRRRSGRDRPAAQAVDGLPPALALDRGGSAAVWACRRRRRGRRPLTEALAGCGVVAAAAMAYGVVAAWRRPTADGLRRRGGGRPAPATASWLPACGGPRRRPSPPR